MSELANFLVPYETIKNKYENHGIMGFGYDWILEL
jgi:hypothetical protein